MKADNIQYAKAALAANEVCVKAGVMTFFYNEDEANGGLFSVWACTCSAGRHYRDLVRLPLNS